MARTKTDSSTKDIPNGAGMAAILAAGIGCTALGVFALAADAFQGVATFLTFYIPTGPLSGVTDATIAVWLAAWFVLAKSWSGRNVSVHRVSIIAFILLAAGLALTFPPFMDLLQGK